MLGRSLSAVHALEEKRVGGRGGGHFPNIGPLVPSGESSNQGGVCKTPLLFGEGSLKMLPGFFFLNKFIYYFFGRIGSLLLRMGFL